MNKGCQSHPAPEVLQNFARGRLSPDELAHLEEHIGSCEECAAALAEVPADTLMAKLRGSNTLIGLQSSDTLGGIDAPGELVDHPRYRILRKLGEGGMGVVYHAVHRLMEREVALKVINTSLTRQQLAVQRFHLEVKAAAKLQHPNIVTAHDAEQVGESHFLVMEYIEGLSIDRLVQKNGRLPLTQACHFIRQAALGLQHAHERGMVHRDIKPQNLMVTRKGQVKVLDFGLARLAQEAGKPDPQGRVLTMIGTVIGTPDYIAPEQVGDSHTVDHRADIYSLGCTLYFMLAGHPPFPEGSALDKALSHVDRFPRPLREIRPSLPAEILPILDRMMAKSPAERYSSATEVAQTLTPFVKSNASSTSSEVERDPIVAEEPAKEQEQPAEPIAVVRTKKVPALEPESRVRPKRKKKRKAKRSWVMVGGACLVLLGILAGAGLAWKKWASPSTPNQGDPPDGQTPLLVSNPPSLKRTTVPPGTSKPRILLVVPKVFWAPDYTGVRAVLDQSNVEVVLASSSRDPAYPEKEGDAVRPTYALSEAKAKDYAGVIFLGGKKIEFVDEPQLTSQARQFIEDMLRQRKLVGAICAGPTVLAAAGVLNGRNATCYPAVQAVLRDKGAKVHVTKRVVCDGSLVTGRDPESAEVFTRAFLKALSERKE